MENSRTKKPAFRWLHISDLHLFGDTDNEQFLRYMLEGNKNSHDQLEQEGLVGIMGSYGGVDCIVATGDFFSRGEVDVDSKERVKQTIERICNQCAETSNWPREEGLNRLCFCPGNHDLIRDAVSDMDENYRRLTRKSCIQNAGNAPDAHLSVSERERNLIVKDTFKPFYETMPNLNNRDDIKILGDGQIVCFRPRVRDANFEPIVIMVGLNTALLAGQYSERPDILNGEVKDQIDTAYKKAWIERKYGEAKTDIASALDKIMQINQDKIDDYGKLCLPDNNAFIELQKYLDQKRDAPVIPVLFGHHSLEFFKPKAQDVMTDFINKNRIGLYLCGHSHQVYDGPINTMPLSRYAVNTCLQVISGGLFLDEERFNQISFSIGSITWNSRMEIPNIVIDYYICMTDANSLHPIGIWTHGQSVWTPQFFGPTVKERKLASRGGENKPVEIEFEERTKKNNKPREELMLLRETKIEEPKNPNEQAPIVELFRMDLFTGKEN